MDHEARNAFEIRGQGTKPVKATITFEMDYQPEFYTVPAALETLIGLQTGEGGVPGLYLISHIASKVWSYSRTQGLVRNTPEGPIITPNEALLTALLDKNTDDAATYLPGVPLDAEKMQKLIKKALGKPHPLILQHDIEVTGQDYSPITCLDLHLEVPLEFSGSKEFAPVVAASENLDKELEQLDNSLAACLHRFKEHKRRRTFLSAFSEDPVGCIREIVLAQGKELRVAAGKEHEAIEVMRSADLYGDKWTQDAILKYINKKQAMAAGVGPLGTTAPQVLMPAAQVQAMAAAQLQIAQARQQAYQQALAQQSQQVAVPLTHVPADGGVAVPAAPAMPAPVSAPAPPPQ